MQLLRDGCSSLAGRTIQNIATWFYLLFLQTLRIFFQGSCGEAELRTTEDGQKQTAVSHPSGDKAET